MIFMNLCEPTKHDQILKIGKLMATTALYREESRNKQHLHRLYYPDSDGASWCGLVVVRKEGDELSCDFEPNGSTGWRIINAPLFLT
jgi:succinate dehydrogenase/fumarate reductase flavoprotein subunit